MNKDSALALRDRLRTAAEQAAIRLGYPIADDGKLYHDELGGAAHWAQRLSRPSSWPHLPGEAGAPACPGLRYEVWFPQGKADEPLRVMLLCGAEHGLAGFQAAIAPVFRELVEGGKFAKRYKPIDAAVTRFYAGSVGVMRAVPADKAEAGLLQLLEDSLKRLDAAVQGSAPEATAAFEAACRAYDPLAALKQRFGG